ncbi:MAG: hypothetical protein ACE5E1_02725 [Phycisphaerae bacterium]
MSNITRWVRRVEGVSLVKTDLNTGTARVWFEQDRAPELSRLWTAVKDVGYEPTRIESHGKTYRRSKHNMGVLPEE